MNDSSNIRAIVHVSMLHTKPGMPWNGQKIQVLICRGVRDPEFGIRGKNSAEIGRDRVAPI